MLKKILSSFILSALSLSAIAQLPSNIKWETNLNEPIFENYNPIKGGEFRDYIDSYPQTFRLYGPSSNSGAFVSYARKWAFWSLVTRHPQSYKHIPQLASHWAVMPDNKTVYYKLEPSAKWSDGKPITADDYVFAYEFMQSPFIQDPFYNQYARDYFQEVRKIDDYTIKIVAKKESWRILDEMDLIPLPKHATKLDKDWVKNAQWLPNVVPGPYSISKFQKGRYVVFSRNKDWWGNNMKYYKQQFNFDTIRLDVIQTPETAFEQFKRGQLSFFQPSPSIWTKKTDIKEVANGLILKRLIYIDAVSGARGFFFNARDPVWSDPKLRLAFAHTIDFASMNKNFFDGLFIRKGGFFDVLPPYKDQSIKAPAFDLTAAAKLLDDAGWIRKGAVREKNGKKLVLSIITGSDEALKYLPYIKETSAKAGIEVEIAKYDGAQFYDLVDGRKYQTVLLAFGGGLFAAPRQFLHTENIQSGTNNIFNYGTPEIDKLIDSYEFDRNEKNRVAAIFKIEQAISQNTLIVPLWKEPATRLLYWRYIKGPQEFIYKNGVDIDLWYFDAKEKGATDAAISGGKQLPKPAVVFDPYGLNK